jgi:hypothetical protein
MERGADRFFADLHDPARRPDGPAPRAAPGPVVSAAVGTLQRHPDFLRLLIVFAAQPPPRVMERYRPWSAGYASTRSICCGNGSRARSATILRARSPTSSRASRWPPSTARSWPVRPAAEPRSSSCSRRSRPLSWRPAGPCRPEAQQAARCPWPAAVSSPGSTVKPRSFEERLFRNGCLPCRARSARGQPTIRVRPHASQRHPGWPVITRAPAAR